MAANKWSLPLSILFIFLVQSIMTVLSREVPNDSGLVAANMHDDEERMAKYNRSTEYSGLPAANMHGEEWRMAKYNHSSVDSGLPAANMHDDEERMAKYNRSSVDSGLPAANMHDDEERMAEYNHGNVDSGLPAANIHDDAWRMVKYNGSSVDSGLLAANIHDDEWRMVKYNRSSVDSGLPAANMHDEERMAKYNISTVDSGLLAANMHDDEEWMAKYNRSTVDSGLLVANMYEPMFPSAPYTGFDYDQWSRSVHKKHRRYCGSQVQRKSNFTERRNKVQNDDVAWINGGISLPVQHQRFCNSCWAFAEVGAVEGRAFRHYEPFHRLSVQQLVDCVSPGRGCDKGFITTALAWMINNQGIAREEDYGEYEGHARGMCREPLPSVKVRCFDLYYNINEYELEALVREGPVAAAINVHPDFVQLAPGEIYEGPCTREINHAIVIVGYGVNEAGQEYWLIKNSWGPGWGSNGLGRLPRRSGIAGGKCGLAMHVVVPHVI